MKPRRGFSARTKCHCGNRTDWEYDSDQMTGSSYAICRRCRTRHPFRRAWVDNALGINFGSWWSQQLAEGFIEQ